MFHLRHPDPISQTIKCLNHHIHNSWQERQWRRMLDPVPAYQQARCWYYFRVNFASGLCLQPCDHPRGGYAIRRAGGEYSVAKRRSCSVAERRTAPSITGSCGWLGHVHVHALDLKTTFSHDPHYSFATYTPLPLTYVLRGKEIPGRRIGPYRLPALRP